MKISSKQALISALVWYFINVPLSFLLLYLGYPVAAVVVITVGVIVMWLITFMQWRS